jgi:hypothetical protein
MFRKPCRACGTKVAVNAKICPACGVHWPTRSMNEILASEKRATVKIPFIAALLIGLAALGIASTQITIFVIQPIGAVPEGQTLIISRAGNLKFVDSADAICARLMKGVNLLCRGLVFGKVAETTTIYARLPYSSILYSISTGGVTYDR